jgi:hypothetical protein
VTALADQNRKEGKNMSSKKHFASFLIALAVALPLSAQEKPYNALGYGYFGLAGTQGSDFGKVLNVGGGGERFLYKGLAVGGDVGYLGHYQNFQRDGFGLASANGSYHFGRAREQKLVPFITAGYGLAFRTDTANLTNVGGGINYWFNNRVGLRLEYRDYFTANDPHMHLVRFGVSFR